MSADTRSINRAIILVILSSFCFSIMQLYAREASRFIPIAQVAFFRLFLTLPVLTPYMIFRRIGLLGSHWKLVLFRGIFGFTSLGLGFFALTIAQLGVVSILWKTSVPMTAILSVVFLRERVTAKLMFLIALCFFGAVLIIKPGVIELNLGTISAVVAGFAVACVSVLIKKLHDSENSLTIIWGFSFWGSILAFIIFGSNFVIPQPAAWYPILMVGLSGLVGQIFFTNAFRFADASTVQPFTYLESVFAFVWGISLFAEVPDMLSIIGSLLIVFAGYKILSLAKKRSANKTSISNSKSTANQDGIVDS